MSYDEDEATSITAAIRKVSPINFGGYGEDIKPFPISALG
jgi:hypothetical protein